MSIASHILVATDLSEQDHPVISKAAELARLVDAKLTLLNVHGHPPAPPEALVEPDKIISSEDLDAESAAILDELKGSLLADVRWVSVDTLEEGEIARGICGYAQQHDVDLIVLGFHERSKLAQLFHGDTAKKVLSRTSCPVLVIPNVEAPA